MAKFILLHGVGKHYLSDNTEVKPGESIETDKDLMSLFPGKFTPEAPQASSGKVHKEAAPTAAVKKKNDGDDKSGNEEGSEEENSKDIDGDGKEDRDVTADFEGAAEAGIKVFKSGRKFIAVNEEDEEEVLSDGPVNTAAIRNVIADYTEGEEE